MILPTCSQHYWKHRNWFNLKWEFARKIEKRREGEKSLLLVICGKVLCEKRTWGGRSDSKWISEERECQLLDNWSDRNYACSIVTVKNLLDCFKVIFRKLSRGNPTECLHINMNYTFWNSLKKIKILLQLLLSKQILHILCYNINNNLQQKETTTNWRPLLNAVAPLTNGYFDNKGNLKLQALVSLTEFIETISKKRRGSIT